MQRLHALEFSLGWGLNKKFKNKQNLTALTKHSFVFSSRIHKDIVK